MVTTFSLDQEAVTFQIKVTDCTDDDIFDVSEVTSQNMIFYKPDGTVLTKTATLVEDTANAGEFFVTYTTSSSDSILDLTGEWEWQAQLIFTSGDIAGTSEKQVGWVVS